MKCMKCGKNAYKSTTCEAIELGVGLLVIRNIPCYKCDECDEIFYTGDVMQKLEEITESVKHQIQEITSLIIPTLHNHISIIQPGSIIKCGLTMRVLTGLFYHMLHFLGFRMRFQANDCYIILIRAINPEHFHF